MVKFWYFVKVRCFFFYLTTKTKKSKKVKASEKTVEIFHIFRKCQVTPKYVIIILCNASNIFWVFFIFLSIFANSFRLCKKSIDSTIFCDVKCLWLKRTIYRLLMKSEKKAKISTINILSCAVNFLTILEWCWIFMQMRWTNYVYYVYGWGSIICIT